MKKEEDTSEDTTQRGVVRLGMPRELNRKIKCILQPAIYVLR